MNQADRNQLTAMLQQAEAICLQVDALKLFAEGLRKQFAVVLAVSCEAPVEPAADSGEPREVVRRYLGRQELVAGSTKVQTGVRPHAGPSDPEQPPQE